MITMHNLGHEMPDYEAEPMLTGTSKNRPTRTVYPEINLRAEEGEELPSLPDGEFMALVKMKKVGFRAPIDDGASKSCDLAVIEMAPVSPEKARELASEGEDESVDTQTKAPRRSLAQSVSMAKESYS